MRWGDVWSDDDDQESDKSVERSTRTIPYMRLFDDDEARSKHFDPDYEVVSCPKLSLQEFYDGEGVFYNGALNDSHWQSINKYHDYIDYVILSESFIRTFYNRIDWKRISGSQSLTLNCIRDFQDRIDWSRIICNTSLTEDCIREFQDRMEWEYIYEYQAIPEDLIRKYHHRIANWDMVFETQKLTMKFIKEHSDKVECEHSKTVAIERYIANWVVFQIKRKRFVALEDALKYNTPKDIIEMINAYL